ncbi:MAG TPA: GFA family protein [Hyphomicrobiales bacterium]|nr:GFA family protein [Hyphomicrobiales bacterium]
MTHQGSCLCGAVTYEITGDLGEGYYCHCMRCQKASGSAFATNARIAPEQFHLTGGADVLKSYVNEGTGLVRKFCGNCGSPIVSERSTPAILAVRLGTLDTPLRRRPVGHIFVESQAEWDVMTDDLPRFMQRPTV